MLKIFSFYLTIVLFQSPLAQAFSVVTGTQGATSAAVEVLRRGGTAADAMVAAAFALNVTEPYNIGIGGGGFFLANQPTKTGNKTSYWDARETAPIATTPELLLQKNGKDPIPYYPERVSGPNPVGVPGFIAGLAEAHKKLGKLPWKTLLQPAIKLAREGFPIPSHFAFVLDEEWPRLRMFPFSLAAFGNGEGSPLVRGQVLRQPLLARTLENIAEKGPKEFYSGALAQSWVARAQELGVRIQPKDVADYKPLVRNPIEYTVFGKTVMTAPPPSASSIAVAGPLRYLEHYYRKHDTPKPNSAERIIVTTEALRYYQEFRNANIADPPHAKIDPQLFYQSGAEFASWSEINKRIASRLEKIETAVTNTTVSEDHYASSHTAHLSVIDDQGLAVAFTGTIEQWFGSGITVTGHGFLLNNQLSDFSPEPENINAPRAGKRPRSNMSPMIILEKGQTLGVVGCAGGARIPTTLVELLENYYVFSMTGAESTAYPRFHPTGEKDLEIEEGYPKAVYERLEEAGYKLKHVTDLGSTAQALLRRTSKLPWEVTAESRSARGYGFQWEPRIK